ncbi:MAG: Universal stress protein family [Herminiimonas sp.]|nr:Universal stress protein family [Herminiimonas sp.]
MYPFSIFAGHQPPERIAILMPTGIAAAAGFEQEPGRSFALIDPDFNQARRCDVPAAGTKVVDLAQARDERLVVVAQIEKHVDRLHVFCIVVEHALEREICPMDRSVPSPSYECARPSGRSWRRALPPARRASSGSHDCDLIFIGSHGRSGFHHAFLGSVTLKLLSASPLPILLYRTLPKSPSSS